MYRLITKWCYIKRAFGLNKIRSKSPIYYILRKTQHLDFNDSLKSLNSDKSLDDFIPSPNHQTNGQTKFT